MAESEYGAQLLNITEDHKYDLNIQELDKLLLNDKVKDLPVVVVSVAGAYRGGKSFMLNFFLRYLKSQKSAQEDGSWIGVGSQPLEGFRWRSGSRRTTMGILMWSEPIITTLPDGVKVAILLMDTQGTFDSKSTVRDCSTIFGVSTLLSSVQIYNLSQNIKEDDLQHLELFLEYGKLAREQGSKPFQVLEFLVRDWQFPEDYAYGTEGGDKLLQEKFQVTPNQPKEMQVLREHIRSSFEKVSCFLMPHPGFEVLKKDFSGNISDIDVEFRTRLIDLVKSLFGPEKLVAKTINGQQIKARDLHNYFRTYITLFNSDEIPNPTSIFKATVEAGLLSILNEARELYENGMKADCGIDQHSVPRVDLQVLHTKHMLDACELFTKEKKMGSKEEADKYFDKLKSEIEQRLPQYVQSNLAKLQALIDKSREAYENSINAVSKGRPLCLHPLDVEKVHRAGVDVALKTFDSGRKRVTLKPDDERAQFIKDFEKKLALLRVSNDQNNVTEVSMIRVEYWQNMESKCALDPPLSERRFKEEHDKEEERALEKFESRRSMPNFYNEDIYKMSLKTKIASIFEQLLTINRNKIDEVEQEERQRIYEENLRRERERIRQKQERERIEQDRRRREWEKERAEQRRREQESKCSIL